MNMGLLICVCYPVLLDVLLDYVSRCIAVELERNLLYMPGIEVEDKKSMINEMVEGGEERRVDNGGEREIRLKV